MAHTLQFQPVDGSAAQLDAEKLDVYGVALQAHAAVTAAVPADQHVLRDQIERASLSTVLNIAEGAGRHSRRDKARHYAIARGSAMECAAALDVLRVRGLIGADDVSRCRSYYVRVVQMLTRLQQRLG